MLLFIQALRNTRWALPAALGLLLSGCAEPTRPAPGEAGPVFSADSGAVRVGSAQPLSSNPTDPACAIRGRVAAQSLVSYEKGRRKLPSAYPCYYLFKRCEIPGGRCRPPWVCC